MPRHMLLAMGLVAAAVAGPMIEGCCCASVDPPPLEEWAKFLQNVQAFVQAATRQELLNGWEDLRDTVQGMSPGELAGAVNIIPGVDWSVGDAEEVQKLASQLDRDTLVRYAQEFDLTASPRDILGLFNQEEIVRALTAVGVEVTDRQVELLRGVHDAILSIENLLSLLSAEPS